MGQMDVGSGPGPRHTSGKRAAGWMENVSGWWGPGWPLAARFGGREAGAVCDVPLNFESGGSGNLDGTRRDWLEARIILHIRPSIHLEFTVLVPDEGLGG